MVCSEYSMDVYKSRKNKHCNSNEKSRNAKRVAPVHLKSIITCKYAVIK